jgi:hypothetical protein
VGVVMFFNLDHVPRQALLQLHNWKSAKDAHAAITQMNAADLGKFLLDAALIGETIVDTFGNSSTGDMLNAAAKHYSIDAKAVRAAATPARPLEEVAVEKPAAKKPSTKKRGKK